MTLNKNKIKGYFKDFEMSSFQAWNNEKKVLLWISNGFWFFKDDSAYFSSTTVKFKKEVPFLSTLNIFEKYTLWKELQREIKRRRGFL